MLCFHYYSIIPNFFTILQIPFSPMRPSLSPWKPLYLFVVSIVLYFAECHINTVIHYVAFPSWLLSLRTAICNCCATRIFKHALPENLVRGPDIFYLKLSYKKKIINGNQHSNSCSLCANQNYTYFCQKYIFLLCPDNFSN